MSFVSGVHLATRTTSLAAIRARRSRPRKFGLLSAGGAASGCFQRFNRSDSTALRPCRLGGQRHQDRLDIAAGLQAEYRPAVVKQIELDVATTADELMAPLLGRPGKPHPLPHDGRINRQEGFADRAKKGKVAFPIAAVEVVKKNPAGAARLAPVLQEEVFVAPRLEAGIAIAVVGGAGVGEGSMEFIDGSRVRVNRGEVGAAAEPGSGGDDVTRIQMNRRNQRRAHMSDERNPARPEARILRRPRDLVAELGSEFAGHRRYVDADLLEDTPAHDRHRPAAAPRTLPLGALETSGYCFRRTILGEFVLDRLECRADPVAQPGEPGLDPAAERTISGEGRGSFGHCPGNSAV